MSTVRVLVTALMTSLLAWSALPATQAHAATQYGYDISWPQCGRDLAPLKNGDFMIIGLTNGLAFTENPCLQTQVNFAKQNRIPVHGYAMATFPNSTQLASYGSSGPWNSATRAGKLSNVGYAEAKAAIDSLSRISWRPDVVWIDVEPRPKSPWPSATAAQRIENRYVIEGLVRGLRDAGFSFYGFASLHHRSQRALDKKNAAGRERLMYADAVFLRDPLPGGPASARPTSGRRLHTLFTSARLLGYGDFALELARTTWADGAERVVAYSRMDPGTALPAPEGVTREQWLAATLVSMKAMPEPVAAQPQAQRAGPGGAGAADGDREVGLDAVALHLGGDRDPLRRQVHRLQCRSLIHI